MTGAKLGTLAWGLKNYGATSASERISLLRNLAFLGAKEAADTAKEKLGLLKPHSVKLSKLTIPDSRMAKDAESFAIETHSRDLLFHSYRTYFFGLFFADAEKISFDRELLFAAAILHDTGLTEARPFPMNQCCFAVSGGKKAKELLLAKKHPPRRVAVVADAISVHLNLLVLEKDYGPEACLVTKGAICDAFGLGHRRVSKDFALSLIRKYPRGDAAKALLKGAEMAPNSRPAFFDKLTGGLPERIWLDDLAQSKRAAKKRG